MNPFNEPDTIYPGRAFVDSEHSIACQICYQFLLHAGIEPFDLRHELYSVRTEQRGALLVCEVRRSLSAKLIETARGGDKMVTRFMLGYLNEVLPALNQHLSAQRYMSGHLLCRTISALDLVGVIIRTAGDDVIVPWPIAIAEAFPTDADLKPQSDCVFARDYMDAMTAYLNYACDESVRKAITSIENFYAHAGIPGETFAQRLTSALAPANYLPQWQQYLPILQDNIKVAYRARNKIVHDEYRIPATQAWFCKKTIGTLSYFYQTALLEDALVKYLFALTRQFLALASIVHGTNLDRLVELKNAEGAPQKMLTTAELDRFMFSSLRITKDEESALALCHELRSGKRAPAVSA